MSTTSTAPTTTPITELNGIEVMAFADAAAWETWLSANWERQEGIWIRIAKVASGIPSVTAPEAIDVALCWGWIDGQRKGLNATHFLQKFTPRRRRSVWSQVNVGKVEALLAAGRMQPPGMAEVEAARADGRWAAAYASQRTAAVPDDLRAALEASPRAREAFDGLTATNRYVALWPLLTARRPETRARRLARLVAALEAGETLQRPTASRLDHERRSP